jgi:hypothetical protein
VSRIEERIAAWTFLPEGEMKSEHSDRLLQFSSVWMCIQIEIFEFDV